MKIARPKYAANKFMTELAWRLLWIYSKISNSSPGITSESARASHRVKRFSNQKIKDYINYEFTPINDAVSNTVNFLTIQEKLK